MVEMMLHTTLGRLTMSAPNVFTTAKYPFPFVRTATKKIPTPMVHRIEFDYGIGTGDMMVGATDYFEIFSQLASRELSQSEIMDEESVIASNAFLLIQGTVEQCIDDQHHGNRVQDFDPPIALPFNELWLSCYSVNATLAKFNCVRIYFTMEDLSAEEIMMAREQYM